MHQLSQALLQLFASSAALDPAYLNCVCFVGSMQLGEPFMLKFGQQIFRVTLHVVEG